VAHETFQPNRARPARVITRRTLILLNVWAQVVLAFTLVLLVNAIAGMTPQTRAWRLDLTHSGRHGITSKTRNVLKNLKDPLTVHVVAGDGLARLPGDRRARVPVMEPLRDILGLYAAASPQVTVQYMDYDRDKQAVLDLQLALNDAVRANSIILRSGTRHETVLFDFLVAKAEEPGGVGRAEDVAFNIEGRLTEAILKVCEERRATVYVLSGYDGFGVTDDDPYVMREFAAALRRENYDLKLLKRGAYDAVPSDCDVLLMVAPAIPLEPVELDAIRRYLEAGGSLFCLLRPRIYSRANAGLADLWREFDCAALDQRLIYEWHETGTPGQRRAEPQVLASRYGNHAITDELRTLRVRADFPVPVVTLREAAAFQSSLPRPGPGVRGRVTPLILSSEESWAEDNYKEPKQDPGDMAGPCVLALAVEGTAPADGQAAAPRIVLCGSCAMLLDEVLKNPDYTGNRVFALNAMSWLSRREYKLGIPPQRSDVRPLNLTRRSGRTVFYVTAGAMPLAAALAGLIVWWRRRRG